MEYRKGRYCQKLYFGLIFHITGIDHKFAALDWNYASVQDTAGHSELKLIDGHFLTFEIDQNKPIDVVPFWQ